MSQYNAGLLTLSWVKSLMLVDIAWSQSALSAAVQNCRMCVQTPSKAMTSKLLDLEKDETYSNHSTVLQWSKNWDCLGSYCSMKYLDEILHSLIVFYNAMLNLKFQIIKIVWICTFLYKISLWLIFWHDGQQLRPF